MIPLRVGVVSFFNALPLSFFLQRHLPNAQIEVKFPSLLSRDLLYGKIDLALLSTIVLAEGYPQIELVRGLGIASMGEVLSVNLFFKDEKFYSYPLEYIQSHGRPKEMPLTIALDPASRSSNGLLQILLKENFPHNYFEFITPPVEMSFADRLDKYGAALAIGNLALQKVNQLPYWDLGAWYYQLYQTPFIFAAWLVRKEKNTPELAHALTLAMQDGLNERDTILNFIAKQEDNNLSKEQMAEYLSKYIHYSMDDSYYAGLKNYYFRLYQYGLTDQIPQF